jgi:aldehyde dehydrogenase (NAD+)
VAQHVQREGRSAVEGRGTSRRGRPGTISAASAPFGGYRCSGNGREVGVFGIEEYLEAKSICGYFA